MGEAVARSNKYKQKGTITQETVNFVLDLEKLEAKYNE